MKNAFSFRTAATICLFAVLAPCVDRLASAAEYTVEMTSDWTFSPNYLEIQVGDTVTWVNHDYAYYFHNSYCPGYWNTGYLDVDDSSSLMFPITGTFYYQDSNFYIFGMTGTIVSKAAAPTQPTPATLMDPMHLQGGAFQFTLSNLVVGASYVIQASTNLVDWSNISTNIASSPVENYMDSGATAFGLRFYRSWHLR